MKPSRSAKYPAELVHAVVDYAWQASIQRAANHFGIPQSTVANWRRGRRRLYGYYVREESK